MLPADLENTADAEEYKQWKYMKSHLKSFTDTVSTVINVMSVLQHLKRDN